MTDNDNTPLLKKTIEIKGEFIQVSGKFAEYDSQVFKVSDRVESIFDYPPEERKLICARINASTNWRDA